MIDHHTEARQVWIRSQSTHETKLKQAVDWLKERKRHCFTEPLSTRVYEPVHGHPLMPTDYRQAVYVSEGAFRAWWWL